MANETKINAAAKTIRTTAQALLGSQATEFEGSIPGDEPLEFEVFDPAVGAMSAGVLVYISPRPSGSMPPAWGEVMAARNLLWVGANDSGNEIAVGRRVELALLALRVAAQCADIDETRSYLGGFSGGGRVASMMMPFYPHLFCGAVFICGANPVGFLEAHQVALMADHRFLFLTGSGDFNRLDSELSQHSFEAAGLGASRVQVVEGMEHALPEPADLDTGLRWLEGDEIP